MDYRSCIVVENEHVQVIVIKKNPYVSDRDDIERAIELLRE